MQLTWVCVWVVAKLAVLDVVISEPSTPDSSWQNRIDGPPPICCGSELPIDREHSPDTGAFDRVASAGSIKVVDVPELELDHYPPVTVRDLRVVDLDSDALTLAWTTPGDDFDAGTVSSYVVRVSDMVDHLRETQFDAAPESTLVAAADMLTAGQVYQEAGTLVNLIVPWNSLHLRSGRLYYLALRAIDDQGNASPVSNMVRFTTTLVQEDAGSSFRNMSQEVKAANTTQTTPRPGTEGENADTTDESESPNTLGGPTKANMVFADPTQTTSVPEDPTQTTSVPEDPIQTTSAPEDPTQTTSVPDLTQTGTLLGGGLLPTDSQYDVNGTDENQTTPRSRNRKNRNKRKKKNKKNKRNKGRKGRKRNNKRQKERRPKENSSPQQTNQYTSGSAECFPQQVDTWQVSLCDAQYSLYIVITYFEQTEEYHHLDYLQAAMRTLQQQMQPAWQQRQHQARRRRSRKWHTTTTQKNNRKTTSDKNNNHR